MIVLSEGSLSAKTAGPLRDPDSLVPPPPYQQFEGSSRNSGGPSTRESGGSSASGTFSSSPLTVPPSLYRATSTPYLTAPAPTHRRDLSTPNISSHPHYPYAVLPEDAARRIASTPTLAVPPSSPARAEFARGRTEQVATRRLDRASRGIKLSTSSDGIAAILNPPPPSFVRPRAHGLPYSPFGPTSLMGISNDLSRSFPVMTPPCATEPHPFATHDVTEQDWTRFLRDIEAAGSLSTLEHIMANISLPSLLGIRLWAGLVVKGVDIWMHGRRRGPVGDLIGYWNHHFFHPRHMHVVLARGSKAYSGPDAVPPDIATPSEDVSSEEIKRRLEAFESEHPRYWRLVVTHKV